MKEKTFEYLVSVRLATGVLLVLIQFALLLIFEDRY